MVGIEKDLGTVTTCDVSAEDTMHNEVDVIWEDTGEVSSCRYGYAGKVDVMTSQQSTIGTFYPDHLPIVG